MRKVILINDSWQKGWGEVFKVIFEQVYKDLIVFDVHTDISNEAIDKCYRDNPGAVFIQDNDLTTNPNEDPVKAGILWVEKYASTRCIIMHTANEKLGWIAGKLGVKYFMTKDDPTRPKSPKEMQEMIIEFHKTIIRHFKLVPELIWVVYLQMGMFKEMDEKGELNDNNQNQ